MDTVALDGQFFEGHIEQGAEVKQGDLLVSFDIEGIKGAGYSLETPIIVTNTNDYFEVVEGKTESVDNADVVITVLH